MIFDKGVSGVALAKKEELRIEEIGAAKFFLTHCRVSRRVDEKKLIGEKRGKPEKVVVLRRKGNGEVNAVFGKGNVGFVGFERLDNEVGLGKTLAEFPDDAGEDIVANSHTGADSKATFAPCGEVGHGLSGLMKGSKNSVSAL